MKIRTKIIALCGGVLASALSANATISTSLTAVGANTDFSATAANGASRSYSDVLASPAGATIAGGQSQGPFGNGVGWGEVFKWAGSANGDVLRAFSMIDLGSSSSNLYQPFLLDLGAVTFNANASTFNPSAQPNLFGATVLNPAAAPASRFLEFDLSGADAVTLTVGHSYAFGLLNLNASDMFFLRDSGFQADPNGAPFQITSGGLAATTATVPGFGGGPRNLEFALYTEPVPEPTTLALLTAGAAGLFIARRKK